MNQQQYKVVVLDDDSDEADFIEAAIAETGSNIHIYHCFNYTDLLAYLKKNDRPHLLLLDINLPGKNGIETIGELKATPEFATIPIVTMSNVYNEKADAESTAAGAEAFIVKPVGMEGYKDIVQMMEHYCSRSAKAPV